MKSLSLATADGLTINAREYQGQGADASHCLVVAPGFAQHSATETFRTLCSGLAAASARLPGLNLLCVDFRGTGQSEGRFGFGRSEFRDVAAAIHHARQTYARVDLLGFSLGAYSSLRAACEGNAPADRLFLVSCPTSINRIVWEGAALRHTLATLTQPSMLRKERHLSFRWGYPLSAKPSAAEFAPLTAKALHFMVGTGDLLVPPSMTRKIYEAATAGEKTWTVREAGLHAELMYFADPGGFRSWLQS